MKNICFLIINNGEFLFEINEETAAPIDIVWSSKTSRKDV